MKKNRNWVLLADFADRTLMRNQLAFTLANSALFADGLKWTPSGVHLHLEIKRSNDATGGYINNLGSHLDPIEFIQSRLAYPPRPLLASHS